LKAKKEELGRKLDVRLYLRRESWSPGLEKLIADALQESDRTTIDEAIEEAEEELEVRQR
jgi:hypothetical protein